MTDVVRGAKFIRTIEQVSSEPITSFGKGTQTNVESRLQRYCECMDLLKLRIEIVVEITTGRRTTGFIVPDQELCCLQLRKSLELIAFAGISANLDRYAQLRSSFHKDWNGKKILSALEKINPDFYPKPIKTFTDSDGRLRYEDIMDGFLRKDDFVELYDWCGEQLHSFNPFDTNRQWEDIRERLVLAQAKLVLLLSQHRCVLPQSDDEIWVNMNDTGHAGKATAYILKRIPDDALEGSIGVGGEKIEDDKRPAEDCASP